jgi:hypothetical protein
MKTAQLGRFDENGNWQRDNRSVAVNGNASSNAAQATTAQATTADRTPSEARPTTARPTTAPAPAPTTARANTQATTADRATGTAGRRSLPRTASTLALFELISGLAIAGAYGVRRLRQ